MVATCHVFIRVIIILMISDYVGTVDYYFYYLLGWNMEEVDDDDDEEKEEGIWI
jgi:hypothetical protein